MNVLFTPTSSRAAANSRKDMLLNNVRYFPLVQLMMVRMCRLIHRRVQTFDNPAGRTAIITVLILIKAIFSRNKMAASHQGLKTSMYLKKCAFVCMFAPDGVAVWV